MSCIVQSSREKIESVTNSSQDELVKRLKDFEQLKADYEKAQEKLKKENRISSEDWNEHRKALRAADHLRIDIQAMKKKYKQETVNVAEAKKVMSAALADAQPSVDDEKALKEYHEMREAKLKSFAIRELRLERAHKKITRAESRLEADLKWNGIIQDQLEWGNSDLRRLQEEVARLKNLVESETALITNIGCV
ncbi:hypothetical protein ACHAXS_008755 [Conticribra weissflogii]